MKNRFWLTRGAAAGLLLFSLVLLTACGSDLPKGAVAQVGQVLISEDAFKEMKTLYESAGRAPDEDAQKDEYRRFEQAIAEYLVNLQILEQEAAAYKVKVTEADVEEEIALFMDMFQGDQKRFEAALEKQHLSLEQFTEQTRERLLLERMKAAVTADVKVTDTEVKAYYEANKSDYVHPEERETSHILIAVPSGDDGATPTQADWDVALSEAEKIRGEIQNGADFSAQARKYSDDESTSESGGDLGPVTKGQMVPAFEEAVFSLKKSEISEPVKTPYGYHLIVVTGITPEEQLSYDRVKEGIRTSLLEQKIEQAWDSWLAQKRAQVGVVYRADLELEDSGSVESDTETTESDTETTEPDPETGEETPTTDTSAE
jgi:foldase protein PrsA